MNNDIYAEWLVKRKKSPFKPLIYVAYVLMVLIGLVACIVNAFGFIFLIAAVVAIYFINMRINVEYEYVFVTNELSIDRILAQRSRKRIKNIEMQKVDKVVSTRSHEFDFARNNPKLKPVDYTSRNEDADVYAIIYGGEQGQEVALIEPNEHLLKCMKNVAPHKVKIDPVIAQKSTN